jgi:O-methyltransferase
MAPSPGAEPLAAASLLHEPQRSLYLDLMKRCLTNTIYGESEAAPFVPRGVAGRALAALSRIAGLALVRPRSFAYEARREGRDWPPYAHSMMGLKRLDSLQACIDEVLSRGIPGDLIETGVWRGGGTIFMRAVLKAAGVTDRRVWVADSFEGLPRPDPTTYPQDAGDVHHAHSELAVGMEKVKENFARYGLLDGQVCFLKGWFRETLPVAPMERLALLRLDGDMYESTIVALESLYPKLSPGGFVIVDDYGAVAACREAVNDYRGSHGVSAEIQRVDWTCVYWKR